MISCSTKEYDCVKSEPRMAKRFVYEFDYNGKTRNHVTDEYGVRDEGLINAVYKVYGVNGCCNVVATYPIKQTSYRVLKDTLIRHGTNCLEWEEKVK